MDDDGDLEELLDLSDSLPISILAKALPANMSTSCSVCAPACSGSPRSVAAMKKKKHDTALTYLLWMSCSHKDGAFAVMGSHEFAVFFTLSGFWFRSQCMSSRCILQPKVRP